MGVFSHAKHMRNRKDVDMFFSEKVALVHIAKWRRNVYNNSWEKNDDWNIVRHVSVCVKKDL